MKRKIKFSMKETIAHVCVCTAADVNDDESK